MRPVPFSTPRGKTILRTGAPLRGDRWTRPGSAGIWNQDPGIWFIADANAKRIHKAIDADAEKWFARGEQNYFGITALNSYLFAHGDNRRNAKKIAKWETLGFSATAKYFEQTKTDKVSALSVAAAANKIYNSTDDGATFGSEVSFGPGGTNFPFFTRPIVTATGRMLVFTVENSGGGPYLNVSRSDDDGATWTSARQAYTWSWPYYPHYSYLAVVHGSTISVITAGAAGGLEGYLHQSTDDGITFAKINASPITYPGEMLGYQVGNLRYVTGAGYVAITPRGYIHTSPDLQTFTDRTTTGTSSAAIYDDKIYRVKADSNQIERSADGITWADWATVRTLPPTGLKKIVGAVNATLTRVGGHSTGTI